jgi:hypothetical protein
MRSFRFRVLIGFTACAAPLALAGGAPAGAAGGVDDFRTKTEKWVETRQIISEEASDWEVERELLRSTRKLLKQEREALRAEISELELSNTQTDEERRDLLLERGEYQRAARALDNRIRTMEEEVLDVAPQLPQPLQKKLEPLLLQIPESPENTSVQLGQRLMNVLGVLAQTEKFNATATFVGETRAVDGEQKMRVRTLYWGLGQAIYVDTRGESAGVGRPGAAGWVFSELPELADEASLLLDIYEGNVDAIEFVRLPVDIR